ncbi:TetR/AcrR family transcriptional regulator [Antrihabitans stalactiti]|uniref:TetR/AcrR family transcriptional regulator n=1 Tax=Antrihabitans stalactiti TaxID=2584121 RepID=A0A848K9Z2_9NOCA|nr:TetR/AcrR family transcriptional regulator [Antrihabitans stalactiti]NMN95725.1 TetR/AcrR family transcriptional regulator [Antrihabitans stalactiti]
MAIVGILQQMLGGDPSDDEGDPAILDGALAAFLDFGIKRTSMNEVAKRSGVSPATLYRRYSSKNAVVQAVGLREAVRFVEAVDARIDRSAPVEEQVTEGFVAFATTLANNRLLRRLLTTEPDVVLPFLTTNAGPLLAVGRAYLAADLRVMQQSGGLPEYDADYVAEILARLALSLALTPDGLIPIDDDAAARDFARAHIGALVRVAPISVE